MKSCCLRSFSKFFVLQVLFVGVIYRFAIADGPGNKDYVIREVCTLGAAPTLSETLQNGSLTFEGKELIIVDPYKKLSLYNVKDLSERIVSLNPLLITAWSDSVTGGIFVRMNAKDNEIEVGRKGKPRFFDVVYFENTNALVNWKPKWTTKIEDDFKKGLRKPVLQWISGAQLFAIYGTSLHPEVTLIDLSGNEVGKFQVPGPISGGIDTSDDGLEVFFLSRGTTEAYVMCGVVDAKYEKLKRVERLYAIGSRMRLNPIGTREIRMRGLKPGDVRKFIELTSQPAYRHRHDLDNLKLEPAHLQSFRHAFTHYITMGKLSFAESPTEFEILPSGVFPQSSMDGFLPFLWRPILYRRSDGFTMLPERTRVIDAVRSDDSWVVSLSTSESVGNSKRAVTYSVCTLATSP